MISNYKNFLLERKLNVELLSRTDEWWENFIEKLKENEPFNLDDFTQVTIDNPRRIIRSIIDTKTDKVDKQKAYDFFTEKGKKGSKYKHNIRLSNGEYIGLNDLDRTKEFGSHPGTSIGTKQTRINETIQCIYLAIRQKKKKPITRDDIQEFIDDYNHDTPYAISIYKKVGSTSKIDVEDLDPGRGWMDTHITIANMLFDYLDEDRKYVFYQAFFDDENSIPKILRRKFYNLIKTLTTVDIDISKWNPSDLFVVNVDKEPELIDKINICGDLEELNTVMDYYFEKKYLIGISLKKINQSKEVRFIVNKEETSKFKYINSSTSTEPTASMSVNIHAEVQSTIPTSNKDQTIVARIFTGEQESNIMLEVRGRDAMYGKVGMSFFNDVLKKAKVRTIPSYNDDEIKNLSNDEILSKINTYYDKLDLEKTKTRGDDHNIGESRSKLIGKLQALMLVEILEENKEVRYFAKGILGTLTSLFHRQTKTEYIIKQLFYYAYAMGNEIFQNCKYFRISNS
jgi:hypothetical protein